LLIANSNAEIYGNITKSTAGIIFIGAPHRDSEEVPWARLMSNLIEAAQFGPGIEKTLLRNLDTSSKISKEISQQFMQQSKDLKILTFIEREIGHSPTASVLVYLLMLASYAALKYN
jgi:hypothetical protein